MIKKAAFTLICLLLFSVGYLIWESNPKSLLAYTENLYTKIKLFTSIIETIQRAYIEEKNPDELINYAIKGVVSNLDPHTNYLAADDFKSWNQSFEGYTGIGITFEIIHNKITVISVLEDGPAAKNGIQPGDKIIAVASEPIIGIKKEAFLQKLFGPAGVPVTITVESTRWPGPKAIQLTRERIILESITQTLLIQPGIGYVKIDRFSGKTSRELEEALNNLESKGMKNLILDLRGNSGGYLNAAIEVADKFIPGGNKLLTTKGRLASAYQEYYSTSESTHRLLPLIVLLDHGSASASEIVAGAIQDLDRGLVIGKTSFGKGLVQSQYRFHDGSALLITTAKYYTPSGRAIQRDYFAKTKDEYYREAYNDELRNIENNKIAKPAHKTLSGRTVYGGGGITPDIWIENPENILSENLRQLFFSEKRHFYSFAEDIIRRNLDIKNKLKHFIKVFHVTEQMYQKFIKNVKNGEPKFSKVDFTSDKKDIRFLLKRELAYLIWGNNARFKVNISRDKQLLEAIKYFPKANNLLSMAEILE